MRKYISLFMNIIVGLPTLIGHIIKRMFENPAKEIAMLAFTGLCRVLSVGMCLACIGIGVGAFASFAIHPSIRNFIYLILDEATVLVVTQIFGRFYFYTYKWIETPEPELIDKDDVPLIEEMPVEDDITDIAAKEVTKRKKAKRKKAKHKKQRKQVVLIKWSMANDREEC